MAEEKTTTNEEEIIESVNNSSKDEYHTQVNNERDPYITCFPTSMINASKVKSLGIIYPTGKEKTGGYSQLEDQFDWFLHNDPTVKEFINSNAGYKNYSGDKRELWDVEVFAFNKWIGRNVCYADYNISVEKMIEIIKDGRSFVTSIAKEKFRHMVSVIGYKQKGKDIKENWENGISFIIDDSYGNLNEDYARKGSSYGNDVEVVKDYFLKLINKGSVMAPKFYAVIFK